ncbi:hypothetical protein Efla_005362 [Eimeria flavescens]
MQTPGPEKAPNGTAEAPLTASEASPSDRPGDSMQGCVQSAEEAAGHGEACREATPKATPAARRLTAACRLNAAAPEDVWTPSEESWAQQPSDSMLQPAAEAGPDQAPADAAAATQHTESSLVAAAACAVHEASVAAAAAASAADAALETASAAAVAAAAAEAAEAALDYSPATAVFLPDPAAAAAAADGLDFARDTADYQVVFVFTNPTSGGNKASAFTRTAVSHLTMTEPHRVKLYIYDIREGLSGRKPGFLLLRAMASRLGASGAPGGAPTGSPNAIRILVAGGDGTVMWCVDEMTNTGVDCDVCAVGVVPYGTGNDFANALGWRPFNAANPFDASLHTLRSLVAHCMRATVVYHDLWSVNVLLKPDESSHRQTRVCCCCMQEVVLRQGVPVRELAFTMSNYFSMGVESRIGRGFDKHRTKSQALNKLRYGIEGFKKTFVTRTQSINQTLHALKVLPNTPDEQVLFTTDKTEANEKKLPLLKKAATLVALNIPSFSGGNDIWAPSRKLGVAFADKEQQQQAKASLLLLAGQQQQQAAGCGSAHRNATGNSATDGRWEARVYDFQKCAFHGHGVRKSIHCSSSSNSKRQPPRQQQRQVSLGCLPFHFAFWSCVRQMLHGRGCRVHSGQGPWEITFKPLDEKTRVYFQRKLLLLSLLSVYLKNAFSPLLAETDGLRFLTFIYGRRILPIDATGLCGGVSQPTNPRVVSSDTCEVKKEKLSGRKPFACWDAAASSPSKPRGEQD